MFRSSFDTLRNIRFAFGLVIAAVAFGPIVQAQTGSDGVSLPKLGLPGASKGSKRKADQYKITGRLEIPSGSKTGRIFLSNDVAAGYHTYSNTQASGGPIPTKIAVTKSADYRITSEFKSDQAPKVIEPSLVANDPSAENPFPVPVEEHHGNVTWSASIEFKDEATAARATVSVKFSGQVCEDGGSCLPPINQTLELRNTLANVASDSPPPKEAAAPTGETSYRGKRTHVVLSGTVTPKVVAPGDKVRVELTAKPDGKYYIYACDPPQPMKTPKATLIEFQSMPLLSRGATTASEEPTEKQVDLQDGGEVMFFHKSPVTWTVELTVAENAVPGSLDISGVIGYQTCMAETCDQPTGASFSATITVGQKTEPGTVPVYFAKSSYSDAEDLAASRPAAEISPAKPKPKAKRTAAKPVAGNSWKDKSTLAVLGLAFLAGAILNVMPCVLPVIGLKVMSFVQQAGESRVRVFALNAWFALGLMSVFWTFATVAVAMSLLGRGTIGWAEQFQHAGFNVGMSSIVFVFALSFFGVWEIPIPGFVGASAANQLATREGAFGAFCKGILATLLATPCTGPLMGPAVTWAVTQPPLLTYAAFTALGLGMASPFLILGTSPTLVKLLPRPGVWMETFKQFMGFILMLTVIWMLFALDKSNIIRALILCVGLAMACWIIGRIDITATFSGKSAGWSKALFVGAFFWFVAFGPLSQFETELPWQTYSRSTLDEHRSAGRTVLVDFTADWCPSCKVNEVIAFNTRATRAFVLKNDVVVLKADKTRNSPEIDEFLEELGNVSLTIPYCVVFPKGGGEPIILDGPLLESHVIESLQMAVSGNSEDTRQVQASATNRDGESKNDAT